MRRLYNQGKILKQEIKRNGWTLRHVAETMGISPGTFDFYVNNRSGIPEPILKGILASFPSINKKVFSFSDAIAVATQQKLALNRTSRKKVVSG